MNLQDITGLTAAEAEAREKAGLINGNFDIPTKSVGEIIRSNTVTFFNMLNLCLAAAVFCTGEYKNMMFLGIIVLNTAIGIIQEIRAKRITDRLSLMSLPKATVIRGGETIETDTSKLVLGDVIILGGGAQIPADSTVISGEIEVNESLITGESDPIMKKGGDGLLSGSFVVCGEAYAVIRKVGKDNFAFSIIKGAKYLKKPVSEILRSVNGIVKTIAAVIIPIAVILTVKSIFFTGDNLPNAVNSSAAAVLGMIPQGLVLLTSVVMAVSAVRLSKHRILARDMYCTETLARVNVLCFDKTGTITSGEMRAEDLIPIGGGSVSEAEDALCALMEALPDKNPTALALRKAYTGKSGMEAAEAIPFSSARKWSGANFNNKGCYVLGAPEFVFKDAWTEELKQKHEELVFAGKRVLVLAKSPGFIKGEALPQPLEAVAILSIGDTVRPETGKTLAFFNKQGVTVKIISGDNPLTVKSAALSAGVKNAGKFIDMSGINPADTGEITRIAEEYTIFGRTTPALKLEIIKALKKNHTVGMVGDGVNDVLPMKEADVSIAMQSGSDAARNVSSLVLLDDRFGSLPKAVAEGRRSINNLERSAALFLTKTVYSSALAVIFLFLTVPYPFIPIQMTLINGLFIGFPSLILALEKNSGPIEGKFIVNVLAKAVPYGLCVVFGIGGLTFFAGHFNFTHEQTRAAATIILGMSSFAVLCGICRPIGRKRLALLAVSGFLFSLAVQFFDGLLSISVFTPVMRIVTFSLCASVIPMCLIFPKITSIKKGENNGK